MLRALAFRNVWKKRKINEKQNENQKVRSCLLHFPVTSIKRAIYGHTKRLLSVAFLQQVGAVREKIISPQLTLSRCKRKENIFLPSPTTFVPQLFSFRAITRRNKPQHIETANKKKMMKKACTHKGWKILLNQIKWDIRLFYTYFSRLRFFIFFLSLFFLASNFSRYVVFPLLFRSDLISSSHRRSLQLWHGKFFT